MVNWLAENSRLLCASLPLPCDDTLESDEEDRDGEEAMVMRLCSEISVQTEVSIKGPGMFQNAARALVLFSFEKKKKKIN